MLISSSKFVLRALSTSAIRAKGIEHVTVVGAGAMGTGIAQVTAESGHKVILVDENNSFLNRSRSTIAASASKIAKKKGLDDDAITEYVRDVLMNISFSTDPIDACKDTDLVIEAITEDLKVKQELFQKIDKAAPSSAIFASNTSGLLIRSIAKVTERKDRFAGLHFFYPTVRMKLCEIVVTPELSTETIEKLQKFGKDIGKVLVRCKDTSGFIVNRLLCPYIFESLRMAERGNATPKDIDMAMKVGCGHPMGPFELIDFTGLDVLQKVMAEWHRMYPDETIFNPSPLLDKKVAEGKFGVKSGEGFYVYNKKK